MVREGLLSDLYFGFDQERLFLRLDARGGPFRDRLAEVDRLRVVFFQPEGFELVVSQPAQKQPVAQWFHDDVLVADAGVEVAADLIFELAIPFRSLAVATEHPLHFCLELTKDDEPIERVPNEGAIETVVPSPDYELMMWQA